MNFVAIPITKGQTLLLDKEDFIRLPKRKIFAQWSPRTGSYYARFNNGNGYKPLIHRFVLGLTKGDRLQVDHVNHETLDNRKENLQILPASENQMSRRLFSSNTTGYKGVSFHKRDKKFQAYRQDQQHRVYLGYFDTAEEAYLATLRD